MRLLCQVGGFERTGRNPRFGRERIWCRHSHRRRRHLCVHNANASLLSHAMVSVTEVGVTVVIDADWHVALSTVT